MKILWYFWLALQLALGIGGSVFNYMSVQAPEAAEADITEDIETLQYNLNGNLGWKVTSAGSGMFRADNVIYRTTDNGTSWIRLSDSLNGTLPSGPALAFTFSTSTDGWLTLNTPQPGIERLYKTRDGGTHWTKVVLEVPANYASSMFDPAPPVFFSSTPYGIIVPEHAVIQNSQGSEESIFLFFVTRDYGNHWTAITDRTTGIWNGLSWSAAEASSTDHYAWEIRIDHNQWTSPDGKEWMKSSL